jgi:transposase
MTVAEVICWPRQEDILPAPISVDLRRRVIALSKLSGTTYAYIAEDLGIGVATVGRILRLHRETGDVCPKPQNGGAPRRLNAAHTEMLVEIVREQPDATTADISAIWNRAHPDLPLAPNTVGKYLRRAGYSYKKSPSGHWSKIPRASKRSGENSKRGSRTKTHPNSILSTSPEATSR